MFHQLYDSCKLLPLEDRDRELEQLWAELEDVPMDPETECIEEPYLHFPVGTNREAIWAWFDCRYSKGVHHLLYGYGGIGRTDEIAKLVYLNGLCDDCESDWCAYNADGTCRYALVHGKKPEWSDHHGCLSCVAKE